MARPAILAVVLLATAAQDPIPRLKFPELRQAQRHRVKGHLAKIPDNLAALDGRWVSVGGYAFLRFDGQVVREILLTENMFSPRGVGALPSPFDSVKIRFAPAADAPKLAQGQFAIVSGRFLVRKEGRLEKEGEQLTALFHVVDAVEGETADPDRPPEPSASAAKGVDKIAFQLLEKSKSLSQGSDVRVPDDVRALDGRWVTVTGNVLIPWAEQRVTQFVLAKNPWDGCCLGIPPGPYDSVLVKLRDGSQLKDRYSTVQTLSGRFRVELERSEGYVTGLYQLIDAVEGAVPSPDEAGGSSGRWGLVGGVAAGALVLGLLAYVLCFRANGGAS
jgi:hypothetical protein